MQDLRLICPLRWASTERKRKMNWKEFKDTIESQGIRDDTEIKYTCPGRIASATFEFLKSDFEKAVTKEKEAVK